MPNTNKDIVYLLAEHVSPSPTVFLRLAAVNKDFHSVFTSDRVWAPLDVYDRKKGIYGDYLEKTASYHGFAEMCWTKVPLKFKTVKVDEIENKYLKLGYYVNYNIEINLVDEPLLRKLVEIKPNSVARFSTALWELKDIIIEAGSKDFSVYDSAPQGFFPLDPDQNRKLLNSLPPIYFGAPSLDAVARHLNPGLVMERIRQDPRLLFDIRLEGALDGDEMTELIDEVACDRKKLLLAVRGHLESLVHFPKYSSDKDVLLAALIYPSRVKYQNISALKQLQDADIALAAVGIHSLYFKDFAPKLQSNQSLVHATICNCTLDDLKVLLDYVEPKQLDDSEILGHVVDIGGLETLQGISRLQRALKTTIEKLFQNLQVGRAACAYQPREMESCF